MNEKKLNALEAFIRLEPNVNFIAQEAKRLFRFSSTHALATIYLRVSGPFDLMHPQHSWTSKKVVEYIRADTTLATWICNHLTLQSSKGLPR